MATTNPTEVLYKNENDELSLPPTPDMRCVSRFSSWSSFYTSSPSPERACCGNSDGEGDDDLDLASNTDQYTSDHSEKVPTIRSENESQSPYSASPDRSLQDSDSGYGSPPVKPSYLANSALPNPSFPRPPISHNWKTAGSPHPDAPSRFSLEEEAVDIAVVPAESLMDCICQTCSVTHEKEVTLTIADGTQHKGFSAFSRHGAAEDPKISQGDLSPWFKPAGLKLKGLRIWSSSRLRHRRPQQEQ